MKLSRSPRIQGHGWKAPILVFLFAAVAFAAFAIGSGVPDTEIEEFVESKGYYVHSVERSWSDSRCPQSNSFWDDEDDEDLWWAWNVEISNRESVNPDRTVTVCAPVGMGEWVLVD